MSKISGIYSIICLENGKYYVGSSSHCLNRNKNHFYHLRRGNHCNAHLQNAYNSYGKDKFAFIILEQNIPNKRLLKTEQLYLDESRKNKDKCFNLSFKASHPEWTAESLKRLSEARTGEGNTFFGKHHSKETKDRIRKANTGKKNQFLGKFHSQESKNKISLSKKGKPSTFLGKKHSPLSIEKNRKSHLGKIPIWSYKPIKQIDIFTNEIIKVWPSTIAATKELKRHGKGISQNLCRRSKSAYGFKWEYA